MMKIEFHANDARDWCIGIAFYTGIDEYGEFKALELGIGLFSLVILKYQ